MRAPNCLKFRNDKATCGKTPLSAMVQQLSLCLHAVPHSFVV